MDPALFPNAATDCSLTLKNFGELLELYAAGSLEFTEGGMGPSSVHRVYLQWICIKGNIPWSAR
jgi:hypothetical protein